MIEAVHEDLVRVGALAPVELDGDEERTWLDCDLASLAENRLGDRTDPRRVDEPRRADWLARATEQRLWSLRSRSKYERCYWILDAGERAGTLALATSSLGGESLRMSSFYVLPDRRGLGVGRRALDRVQEALGRYELGLRLETSWCWQRAVRFYIASGLWIYMWKRDLSFCWYPTTPRPRIEVGEGEASLSVTLGGEQVTLARAHRRGDRLELEEPPEEVAKNRALGESFWHASSTLSLALALHGWPLVRSEERWRRCYHADAGAPEALAYKITIWEALAAKSGWLVGTPRIPGLEYPTWDDFEARWEAENKEFEALRQRERPAEAPRP